MGLRSLFRRHKKKESFFDDPKLARLARKDPRIRTLLKEKDKEKKMAGHNPYYK